MSEEIGGTLSPMGEEIVNFVPLRRDNQQRHIPVSSIVILRSNCSFTLTYDPNQTSIKENFQGIHKESDPFICHETNETFSFAYLCIFSKLTSKGLLP